MKNLYGVLLALCASLILGGCATPGMTFDTESEQLADKTNPVFLMTASLKNNYRPAFTPRAEAIFIGKPDGNEKTKSSMLAILSLDDKARNYNEDDEEGKPYLLRFELPPGSYEFVGIRSMAKRFPIIGHYFTSAYIPFEARERGVFYLGHFAGVMRKRNDGEIAAGPVLPLLDAMISGSATGTFDVEITDQFETDELLFRKNFPVLANAPIKKAILPLYDAEHAKLRARR